MGVLRGEESEATERIDGGANNDEFCRTQSKFQLAAEVVAQNDLQTIPFVDGSGVT